MFFTKSPKFEDWQGPYEISKNCLTITEALCSIIVNVNDKILTQIHTSSNTGSITTDNNGYQTLYLFILFILKWVYCTHKFYKL